MVVELLNFEHTCYLLCSVCKETGILDETLSLWICVMWVSGYYACVMNYCKRKILQECPPVLSVAEWKIDEGTQVYSITWYQPCRGMFTLLHRFTVSVFWITYGELNGQRVFTFGLMYMPEFGWRSDPSYENFELPNIRVVLWPVFGSPKSPGDTSIPALSIITSYDRLCFEGF